MSHLKDILNLSTKYVEVSGGDSLRIEAPIVAACQWQNMVRETQQDGKERGVVVSRRNNTVMTSDVLMGSAEEGDLDGKRRASFTPPLFPHGLWSIIPGTKNVVIIHTHFMPSTSNHLRTTLFSDADIHRFVTSNLHGIAMVDRGGAHVLIRIHRSFRQRELLVRNIVSASVKRGVQRRVEVLDVIKDVASQLANYGLGYLYTSTLIPNPGGFIAFQKLW